MYLSYLLAAHSIATMERAGRVNWFSGIIAPPRGFFHALKVPVVQHLCPHSRDQIIEQLDEPSVNHGINAPRM